MKHLVVAILATLLACGSPAVQAQANPDVGSKPAPKAKRKPRPLFESFEGRWYVGAALGSNTFRDWSSAETTNDGSYRSVGGDDGGSGQLFVGIDFNKYHAFEFAYADFGTASYTAQSDGSGLVWNAGPVHETLELSGYMLSYQGGLPVAPRTLLFARAGILNWKSDSVYGGDTQSVGPVRYHYRGSDWNALIGGGVAFDPSPAWRLRGSYMRYALTQPALAERKAVLTSLEVSLAYRF